MSSDNEASHAFLLHALLPLSSPNIAIGVDPEDMCWCWCCSLPLVARSTSRQRMNRSAASERSAASVCGARNNPCRRAACDAGRNDENLPCSSLCSENVDPDVIEVEKGIMGMLEESPGMIARSCSVSANIDEVRQ